MQLRRAALVFTLAAGSHLFAAEAGIEFSGVLTADGKTRIALTDVVSRSTTWVQAGEIFNGYTVARYDAKEDAVLLTKGGQELRLRLELPKTPDAGRPNASVAANPPNSAGPAGPTISPSAANPPPSPATPNAAATIATSPSAAPAVAPAPASPAGNAVPNPSSVAGTPSAPPTQSAPPVSPNPAAAAPAPSATSSTASLPPVPESLPPTGRQTASPSYTIQGGDTLDSIALTQGVTVQQIRELNPALNSTSLRAGDTIRIR